MAETAGTDSALDGDDVSLDAPLVRGSDELSLDPHWLWVRRRTRDPKREVWEKFFADEAPWDALDYQAAEASGPPPKMPSPRLPAAREVERLPQIMTVEETAALLRMNVKTAYDKIKRGKIPGGLHLEGVVRVSKAALLEAFRAGLAPRGRRR